MQKHNNIMLLWAGVKVAVAEKPYTIQLEILEDWNSTFYSLVTYQFLER